MSDSATATPWTIARQASLSMGFPRQEYWSEFPFLSPGDLPDLGTKLLHWRVNSLSESPGKLNVAKIKCYVLGISEQDVASK